MSRFLSIAATSTLALAYVSAAGAQTKPAMPVIVTNSALPVQVQGTPNVNVANSQPLNVSGTVDVASLPAPPVWRGTPFASSQVVIWDSTTGDHYYCETIYTAQASKVLMLRTATGYTSGPAPRGGGLYLNIYPYGGNQTQMPFPLAAGPQASGYLNTYYSTFSGTINFDGFPVTRVDACVAPGNDVYNRTVGQVALIGFEFTLAN